MPISVINKNKSRMPATDGWWVGNKGVLGMVILNTSRECSHKTDLQTAGGVLPAVRDVGER